MGALLSSIRGGGTTKVSSYDVYLDFKNAQPTSLEKELYDNVCDKFGSYQDVLKSLETFDGCKSEIQNSIGEPDNQQYEDDMCKYIYIYMCVCVCGVCVCVFSS